MLGITYRRVPVLAMGKDVYCDTSAIIAAIQHQFQMVRTGPADRAYEAFASQFFENVLRAVPAKFMNPSFKRDRETIFRESFLFDFQYDHLPDSCTPELKPFLAGQTLTRCVRVLWAASYPS